MAAIHPKVFSYKMRGIGFRNSKGDLVMHGEFKRKYFSRGREEKFFFAFFLTSASLLGTTPRVTGSSWTHSGLTEKKRE